MYRHICVFLSALALYFAPSLAFANTPEENGRLLAEAMQAIDSDDWDRAQGIAARISDPVGADFVTWSRLRDGAAAWREYESFLARNGDWPGLKRLRRAGEEAIPKDHDPDSVRRFFAGQPPQTGTGALRLAEALTAQGQDLAARETIVSAWLEMALAEHEEQAFLDRFGKLLSAYHEERLENLLWQGQTTQAERMLGRVSGEAARLAKARIGLQQMERGVDSLIAAVPKKMADDAGLAFDRFMWRIRKERWDDAEALILERSATEEALGRPEDWSNRRRGFARRAMRAGDANKAYLLASQHGLTAGSDYADLEWLSGYIALRYMEAPEQALFHFTRFWSAVSSPISIGRAGYWLGQAYEVLDRPEEAMQAYKLGARHQTGFYGQLAAERIGQVTDANLVGRRAPANWRGAAFFKSGPVRAGLLLHYAGQQPMMRWFLTHVAETLDEPSLSQLSHLALDLDRPNVALGIAKEAAQRGVILPEAYFPITDLARHSLDVHPEVAMSIARRESEFNDAAVSPAGARGLMQIMPGTAREVSRDIGVGYSKTRLTTDWRYNAMLSAAYLDRLVAAYNGSYLLAFAAYNAGPSRVDEWVSQYGDPRDPKVDKVDWVEHIPYRETRNYVMRVMESLHVYRARLSGRALPVQITQDMSRG